MTKPEKHLWFILDQLGFVVKPYKNRTIIDPLNCIYFQMNFNAMHLDFALPSAKIAIEVNGDYWHGSRRKIITASQLRRQLGDATKTLELSQNGWQLLTIIASDLRRQDFVQKLQSRLLDMFLV